MVQDDTVVSVLSDFARTRTDVPVQGILDHLVQRIVNVLPVTGAGVTLIAPGSTPRYVAASSTAALSYELLQSELGQGPCLMAYETGGTVSAPDLLRDPRFTGFALAARGAGLRAVFALPLRHGDGRLGALDLYRDTPGGLDPRDLAAAQMLADVAAAHLLNVQARGEALEVSERHRERSIQDPLTGLPDRSLRPERREHAAQRAHRPHAQAAVLLVDLFPTAGAAARITASVGVACAGPGQAVLDQLITHDALWRWSRRSASGAARTSSSTCGAPRPRRHLPVQRTPREARASAYGHGCPRESVTTDRPRMTRPEAAHDPHGG